MNLKQLQYAVTLSREGSFSKAADVLGISQPSLSQYIKKIEEETSCVLFERKGTSVRLTEAGKIYIDTGLRILELEKKMKNALSDLSYYKTGTLTVGTSPYRSARFMPAAAAAFREAYPGVSLTVDERGTQELLEGVGHAEFDLCVTVLPVDENLYSYTVLHEENFLLAVPKGSALDQKLAAGTAPGNDFPVADLALADGSDFVMLTEGQFMQRLLRKLADQQNLTLNPAVTVKSLEAQIAMVARGLGAALIPEGLEAFAAPDSVSCYRLTGDLASRQVAAVWRKGDDLSEIARAFVDILQKNV